MNIDQLLADIRITFPGVAIQSRENCISKAPAWMLCAETSVLMADQLPVFSDHFDADSHDGGIHTAFSAWLDARGWYLERHDEFWFQPTPNPTAEELAIYERQHADFVARHAVADPHLVDNGLPF